MCFKLALKNNKIVQKMLNNIYIIQRELFPDIFSYRYRLHQRDKIFEKDALKRTVLILFLIWFMYLAEITQM